MLAQRLMQQSLRRAAFQQPTTFSRAAVSKFSPPALIAATNKCTQKRFAATQNVSQNEAYKMLEDQRLKRPVAPHLSIYSLQAQMQSSVLNRITGCVMSGTLYVFAVSYLAAPLFGWHLESHALAAAFGSLPLAAKGAVKFGLALPFAYHAINGVRHLVWDTAGMMKHKHIVSTTVVVYALTVVSAGYLAFT